MNHPNEDNHTMSYQDLLNSSHDSQFDSVPNLTWRPWVGKRFHHEKPAGKLLIVGESHYARASKSKTVEIIAEEHTKNGEFTREIVFEGPICGEDGNPTMDNIPRLFLGSPDYKQSNFWQDVAFYNFIQRIMVKKADTIERPTNEDFSGSWHVFTHVVAILKPDYCVFLGSTAHNSFWSAMNSKGAKFDDVEKRGKIGRYWSYRAGLRFEEKLVSIVFVKHPGSYFSSTGWHEFISKEYPMEIAAMRAEYSA